MIVAEVVEEGGGSAAHRAGPLAGQPQAGGEAAWIGSSEKAGFNQSTDTTSVLDPSWIRKNLSFLSRMRYGSRYKGAKEGMDASSRTNTNCAPTRQVEVVEAENCGHDVVEVWQIQQECSQSFAETKLR